MAARSPPRRPATSGPGRAGQVAHVADDAARLEAAADHLRKAAPGGGTVSTRTCDGMDGGQVTPLRGLELSQPPRELAFDVGLLASEVAQADRVGIDRVQSGQDLGDGATDHPALGHREGLGLEIVGQLWQRPEKHRMTRYGIYRRDALGKLAGLR